MSPRRVTIVAAVAGLAMTVLMASWLIVGGSPTRIAVAIALSLAGPALWLAWTRPVIFPFCAYAAVVPFNDLLFVGHTGTLTFLLGAFTAVTFVIAFLRQRRIGRPGTALIAWWVVAALSVLSGLWALEPIAWAPLSTTFVQLVATYTVIAFYPFTRSDLRWLFGALIAGAASAGAYGSYLFAHAMFITSDQRLYIISGDVKADPNHFATAMLMPLTLAVVIGAASKNWWLKLIAAAAIAAMAGGIVVSSSRGALSAVIVAVIYILIRLRQRAQVLAFAAIGMVVALPFWPELIGRISIALSSGGAGRTDIWRAGVEAFKSHWLFGVGLGGFPAAFDRAYLTVHFPHHFGTWHKAAHNLILEYGVELGVIGALAVLCAWWYTFRSTATIAADDPLYPVKIGVESGVIALFIASLFLDITFSKYTWLAFTVVAAVCAAAPSVAAHVIPRSSPAARRWLHTQPSRVRSIQT